MKKILILILMLCIMPTQLTFGQLDMDPIEGQSAILINGDTGQILYEKNMHDLMYPASTTKILTAIICLEDLKQDEVVTIDEFSPYAGGSHIALEPGEQLTVGQLINALLITSANDAAEALARHHSGSIEAFADVMNKRAADLGALNSNFVNPHGLHDENHVTTAYDLAIVSKYAMKNEVFREIVKTLQYEIPITNIKKEPRYLNNGTSLFHGMAGSSDIIVINEENVTTSYPFATGIKRGFTPEARYCFVGSSTVEGRNFISVVLKSEAGTVFQDTRILLEYGATQTKAIVLPVDSQPTASILVKRQKDTQIIGQVPMDVVIDVALDVQPEQITFNDELKNNIELPVSKGEVIGTRNYSIGDISLVRIDLVSDGYYIGDNLLNDEIFVYQIQKISIKSIIKHVPTLLISLLLWRTLMTLFNLSKRNQKTNIKVK